MSCKGVWTSELTDPHAAAQVDLADALAEARRITTIMSGIAPKKNKRGLEAQDLKTLQSLMERLRKVGGEALAALNTLVAAPAPSKVLAINTSQLTSLESDVVSALMNLGCTRQIAEKSVRETRKLVAVGDNSQETFEVRFRVALERIR